VTASLDVRTQGLRDGVSARIEETQRDLEMSLGMRTGIFYEEMADTKRDLRKEMADTKRDLNEELDRKILEALIDIQATKTQVKVTRRELRTQLELFEARSELGSYRRTRTGACVAKPTKFDGYTSWAVFRRQLETVAEHNCWTPWERATYLIAALRGRASDVLHGVQKGATYDETLEDLEDRFGD
jgi:hypothetical protein